MISYKYTNLFYRLTRKEIITFNIEKINIFYIYRAERRMVCKPIISVDGQPSERKRQTSAVQWTIGTLSVNSPPTKSPVIPSSLSTDDEIS